MKKKILISISILVALISVLILNELVKAGAVYVFYTHDISFVLKGISLNTVFTLPESHNLISDTIIYLLPIFSVIIFIEFSALFLSKVYNNNIRTGLIIYQMINIGYLVIAILLNALSVIINNFLSTDWSVYIFISGYSYTKSLLITFLLILIIFTHINFATNRIKKYVIFIKS